MNSRVVVMSTAGAWEFGEWRVVEAELSPVDGEQAPALTENRLETHLHTEPTWTVKSQDSIEIEDVWHIEDPDSSLELREEFAAEVQISLAAVAQGAATTPAEQVASNLGLSW